VSDLLKKGDLVRMTEPWAHDPDSITWCYGVFLATREVEFGPLAFVKSEMQDLILCEGRPQLFDHYWHKEKIA